MNKPKNMSFVRILSIAVLLLLPIFAGCAQQHVINFSSNTKPSGAYIVVGTYSKNEVYVLHSPYIYKVTEFDFEKGKVMLPKLTFLKEGYIPYEYPRNEIEVDEKFRREGWFNANGQKVHSYHNTNTIHLEKDPDYWGSSSNPNKLWIIINSEPSGAKLYGDGKLLGTTPYKGFWELEPQHYKLKELTWGPMVVVKEGCLAHEEQRIKLQIDPAWRYEQGKSFETARLVILKNDPSYRFAPQVNTQGQQRRNAGDYSAAQREYDQALAAYNQALKELNNARTLAAAPKKYPHPALGALMAIAEPHSVAEAERKVEIARQRLERAKARMNHSEW